MYFGHTHAETQNQSNFLILEISHALNEKNKLAINQYLIIIIRCLKFENFTISSEMLNCFGYFDSFPWSSS